MMSPRWRHARLPAIAAVALWASQDTTTKPRPNEEPRAKMPEPIVSEVQPLSENPPDVTLTCKVEQQEARLRIHYFLANQSSESIFTFDRIRFNAMNTVKLPADVVCDAGAGAVNVVLGTSPDPVFGTIATTYPHSWSQEVSRLEASKNVAATIDLALPLVEWDLWNGNTAWSKTATAHQAVQVHAVRLVVDFVRLTREGLVPAQPGLSAVSVWCEAPLGTPVTLLRHPGITGISGIGDLPRLPRPLYRTTPRRRGTSPTDMPRNRQRQF